MEEAVVDILGLGRKMDSLLDMAQFIEKGLPAKSIDHLKVALQLNDEEISSTLGVSPKTISRLRSEPKKKLRVVVGDRLYRAAHVYALAMAVLGNEEQAREWLRSPKIGLGNRAPLDLLATGAGTREVEDLLGRIEHGVLS